MDWLLFFLVVAFAAAAKTLESQNHELRQTLERRQRRINVLEREVRERRRWT